MDLLPQTALQAQASLGARPEGLPHWSQVPIPVEDWPQVQLGSPGRWEGQQWGEDAAFLPPARPSCSSYSQPHGAAHPDAGQRGLAPQTLHPGATGSG